MNAIRIAALTLFLMPSITLAQETRSPFYSFSFPSADGGTLEMSDWQGRPVLVVNTASRCGFTPQYDALQEVYDQYSAQGMVVLAVPSDDFGQELSDVDAVKEFCEVNFDLTLPMTDITVVTGENAHEFYQWVKSETGFSPRWNFNKILISDAGEIAGTWASSVSPTSAKIVDSVRPFLH